MSSTSFFVFRRHLGIPLLGLIIASASAGCVANAGDDDIVEVRAALSSPAPLFTVVGETPAQANSIRPTATAPSARRSSCRRSTASSTSRTAAARCCSASARTTSGRRSRGRTRARLIPRPASMRLAAGSSSPPPPTPSTRSTPGCYRREPDVGSHRRLAPVRHPGESRAAALAGLPAARLQQEVIVVGGLNVGSEVAPSERIQWVFDKPRLRGDQLGFQRLIVQSVLCPASSCGDIRQRHRRSVLSPRHRLDPSSSGGSAGQSGARCSASSTRSRRRRRRR